MNSDGLSVVSVGNVVNVGIGGELGSTFFRMSSLLMGGKFGIGLTRLFNNGCDAVADVDAAGVVVAAVAGAVVADEDD